MNLRRFVAFIATGALCCANCFAGIYSGPTDTLHSIDPAIANDDPNIVAWATKIDESRTHFAPRGSSAVNQTGGFNSLGDLDTAEIASGMNPGHLTVTFDRAIANGPGHDFAVFENGGTFFPDPFLFAELAFVEVSTDGANFARFNSISSNSETDLYAPFGRSFAGLDTTNVLNLAGKHASGFGTPFDLDSLSTSPLVINGQLDLNNIQYVRLVDIPGNGDFLDGQSNPIFDAWLTAGSGGFDFRLGPGHGVGVFNVTAVPEPNSIGILSLTGLMFACLRRRRHVTH